MEARILLAWLLELIRHAPEPLISAQAPGDGDALELVFRGRTFRIRVEAV